MTQPTHDPAPLDYSSPADPADTPIIHWFAVLISIAFLLYTLSPLVFHPDSTFPIYWLLVAFADAWVVAAAIHCTRHHRFAGLITRIARAISLTTLLLAIFAFVLFSSQSGDRGTRNYVKCASNLRQIGQAIWLYANEHGGQYPPDLKEVLLTEEISPEVFVCPSSALTPATGPTTQALVSSLPAGHCSYIYIGAGFTTSSVAKNVVIAYEPQPGHIDVPNPPSINVLFGDFRVEMLTPRQFQSINNQLAAHKTAVVWPLTGADLPE